MTSDKVIIVIGIQIRPLFREPSKLAENGQNIEKFQIVQISSRTSDNLISAIGTDLHPLSREIQALKVGRKW